MSQRHRAWDEESDDRLPFGELAVLEEMITRDQLSSLLYQQAERRDQENKNVRIGTLLVREGYLSKREAKRLLKIQKGAGPIDGFQLTEHLGSGGMGSVFRAIEAATERELAVKILPPRATRDSRYRARFLREAELLKALDHVNLVQCYTSGECGDHLYFAMELVPGLTGRELLKKEGALREGPIRSDGVTVRSAMRQVLLAMDHYWEARIVHRDIKPENIMFTEDGTAKLMDLGLSRKLDDDVRVTRIGKTLGTPLYISPELAKGASEIDIRSDLYSLGATFYHLACGVAPFMASSQAALLKMHVEDLPLRPRLKNPRLTAGMEAILLQLLEKDPRDRFSSPRAVLDALDRLDKGLDPLPRVSPSGRALTARKYGSSGRVNTLKRRTKTHGSSATRTAWRPPTRRRSLMAKLTPLAAFMAFVGLFALGVVLGSRTSSEAAASSTQAATTQAAVTSAEFVKLAETDPQAAAQAALEFCRAHPDAFSDQVFQLEAAATRLPAGDTLTKQLQEKATEAKAALDKEALKSLDALRSRLIKLVEGGKYVEARAALNAFPPEYRATAAGDGYQELKRELELAATPAPKKK